MTEHEDPHPSMHLVPEDPALFLEVRCPFCGAEPGESCVSPSGPRDDPHSRRREEWFARATALPPEGGAP